MSWLRLDDGFATHNKVLPLSDAAVRLWLMASCWSRLPQNLKHEGKIQTALLSGIAQHRYPARKLAQLAQELVDATAGGLYEHGLWLPTDSGWLIHKWHKYGIITAEPDSVSAKRSDAGKRGAASRWQVDGKGHGKPMAKGRQTDSKRMPPIPIPIPIPRSDLPPPPSVGTPQGGESDISPGDLASFAPEPAEIIAKRPKKRQSPYPDGLAPLERQREKCAELRLDCAREFERFSAYHQAKGSVFADWSRAFDTWLGNAPSFQRSGGQREQRPRQPDEGYSAFSHAKEIVG